MMDDLDLKVRTQLIKQIGLTMGANCVENKSGIIFEKGAEISEQGTPRKSIPSPLPANGTPQ